MAAAVTPLGDGFGGGTKTTLSRPDLVAGTFGPASVGGSLIGGVAPGLQRAARNDRGTNVPLPYARVVFHPGATTALPKVNKEFDNTNKYGLNGSLPSAESIVETDYLGSGTLGFVLGRRGKSYDSQVAATMGLDTAVGAGNMLFSRDQNRLAQFALVGAGVDTNHSHRMCSYEYLDSYFYHVLRKKVINLKEVVTADEAKYILRRFSKNGRPVVVGARLMKMDAMVMSKAILGIKGADPAPVPFNVKGRKQGIFVGDAGPFLRGYTIDRRFVGEDSRLSAGFADQMAFDVLQQRLGEIGLCDWTPDGIVHSKLSSGDAATDYEMDSRDGQLFNVVIKGSAVTSTWCYDKYRDVMPGDQLFIVLVGDVWQENNLDLTTAGAWKDDATYEAKKTTAMDPAEAYTPALAVFNFTQDYAGYPSVQITNIRPRLITSTEMMAYSSVLPSKPMNESDRTSRLGLRASQQCREYIIGGWSIGNVIDNSASRPVEDRASLGIAKRAKTSHACNVLVNVRWQSADYLYRCFMNKEGKLRSRFTAGPPLVPTDNINARVTKR